MAEVNSPTVARRRVRLALREAREAADLTQLHVAEEMEWSLSKVIRIENGDVSISPNDLKPLLAFLGVKDRALINSLIADAKVARTRQRLAWYQMPEFRGLDDSLLKFIEYEAVATAIRTFSIRYLYGPLQLPEYSTALTGSFDDEIPPERIAMLLEARKQRRDAFRSRLGSLKYYAVFDEAVFMRTTGGPEVFAAQLRDLQDLAERELIHLRMLPFDLHTPIANNASFDLLSLDDSEEGNLVLYRENGYTDELVEERDSTTRHLTRFKQLYDVAADEAYTIEYLKRRIASVESPVTFGGENP